MELDETDNKILNVLRYNSKLSYSNIAKKLLMPVTTVHHRIKKLEKEGIIAGYSLFLDYNKIGKGICAYILLRVDYLSLNKAKLTQHELALKLRHKTDVEDVALITGIKDIILKVRTSSVDLLNKFITEELRNIGGVKSTETLLVLEEL